MRIASLYGRPFDLSAPSSMSQIRWLRMGAALHRLGYSVDLILPPGARGRPLPDAGVELRTVPIREARWHDYDVVKVSYQKGYELLRSAGGAEHPFVICRLGAVVDKEDRRDIAFVGREREILYGIQEAISGQARCIAVLTEAERALWAKLFGQHAELLLVPTGVDATLPARGPTPYPVFPEKIALFAGNLRGLTRSYRAPGRPASTFSSQREMNALWQERLNRIGRKLRESGIRLCCVGPGLNDRLDPNCVTHLGTVPNSDIWDHYYHADVGLALAQGPEQLHECSKLYYYMRSGLPAVSEDPIPNNDLIAETGLGAVAAFGDDEMIVSLIRSEVSRNHANRIAAMESMRSRHSWDRRAAVYDEFIQRESGAF